MVRGYIEGIMMEIESYLLSDLKNLKEVIHSVIQVQLRLQLQPPNTHGLTDQNTYYNFSSFEMDIQGKIIQG